MGKTIIATTNLEYAASQCHLAKHKGGRPFLGPMYNDKVDHLMPKP